MYVSATDSCLTEDCASAPKPCHDTGVVIIPAHLSNTEAFSALYNRAGWTGNSNLAPTFDENYSLKTLEDAENKFSTKCFVQLSEQFCDYVDGRYMKLWFPLYENGRRLKVHDYNQVNGACAAQDALAKSPNLPRAKPSV